uniref:Uncharacterized protein n=1 Tax=Anguilla anguilla TaxID=7936 RepID=A0A0E9VCU4_ANGAN
MTLANLISLTHFRLALLF